MTRTLIADDINFKGDILVNDGLIVAGKVEGRIVSEGVVDIQNSAEVIANIEAEKINISGNVQGNIITKEDLSIHSSGKLHGDIKCKSLLIEKGALHNGTTIMFK